MLRIISVLGLCLGLVGLSTGVATAEIIITGNEIRDAISGDGAGDFAVPDAELNGKGWKSWQVNATTDDGDLITAVDVRFEGPLHQRWFDADFGGVADDPTPVGAAGNSRGDSHLTPVAGALIGSAPTEDNNSNPDFNSPLPPDAQRGYGVGTFMSGAWGIPGASQTTSTTLGLVVQPSGQQGWLTYDISTTNGRFSGTVQVPIIPEPGSAFLAIVGMVPYCHRRRR